MAEVTISSLKESIDSLNSSINSLIKLLRDATEELKMEEHDSEVVDKKISPILGKIKSLEEQNEKIARGIVAVADMLKERKMQPRFTPQKPYIPTAPLIKPGPLPQQQEPNFKPLPRTESEKREERKGFFDMFKK